MLTIWQMGLSAVALIILTALLRRFASDRLPRRMYIALWDLAVLSMLIPYRPAWNPLSLLQKLQRSAHTNPHLNYYI